jgi:hypothetical protein
VVFAARRHKANNAVPTPTPPVLILATGNQEKTP